MVSPDYLQGFQDHFNELMNIRDWAGLKSIAMTRNTITKNSQVTMQTRYFISSLASDAKEVARAIRGHWMVESDHWHLDVTFREDADHTLNKHVAYNLNILRKLALNLLKLIDVGRKNMLEKEALHNLLQAAEIFQPVTGGLTRVQNSIPLAFA